MELPSPFNRLYTEMIDQLQQLENKGVDTVVFAEHAAALCHDTIQVLRKEALQIPFADEQSEIGFFKYVKPRFTCYFLYYQQLYFIESRKPVGGIDAQIRYFRNKLRKVQDHYEDNTEFYQYLRINANDRDHLYFLRAKPIAKPVLPFVQADGDPSFTTPSDLLVAEILHNELLERYLLSSLQSLTGKQEMPTLGEEKDAIYWTGPINGFHQLLRTLISKGDINNGKISISKASESIGSFFHVNLKNYARSFQETMIKKDPLDYMKGLVKVAQKDIDRQDENPRYR